MSNAHVHHVFADILDSFGGPVMQQEQQRREERIVARRQESGHNLAPWNPRPVNYGAQRAARLAFEAEKAARVAKAGSAS